MILDVLACFPFGLIESLGNEQNNSKSDGSSQNYKNFMRLVRLPRLYRLLRISRMFKMLKTNRYNATLLKIQDFFRLNNSAIRLMSIFLTVIVMAHIIA
jgi:hypothetical protein